MTIKVLASQVSIIHRKILCARSVTSQLSDAQYFFEVPSEMGTFLYYLDMVVDSCPAKEDHKCSKLPSERPTWPSQVSQFRFT